MGSDRKVCRKCGKEKALTDFHRAAASRDGHRHDCKVCNLAARAARYRANPEIYIRRTQQWRDENRNAYLKYQRDYSASDARKARDRSGYLQRKYGITLKQYDEMLTAQNGVCAICRQPRPEERTLHVDHDHETGEIRGLLCFKCNNALGDFGDSYELLSRAIDYIDRDDELVALARDRAHALIAQPS